MQGILLIGMPGSGKSTVGRKVAELLSFKFFDGDEEIEKAHPDRQAFLDKNGDEAYVAMEADTLMKLPMQNAVLAPGGSIIYAQKAMNHFGSCFKAYTKASIRTVEGNLSKIDIDQRGIVGLKQKGIRKLY